MELRASAIAVLGCGWATLLHIPLTAANAVFLAVGGMILLWLEYQSQSSKMGYSTHESGFYRLNSGRAYYCGILLPLAFILSQLRLMKLSSENLPPGEEPVPTRGCQMLILYSFFLVFSTLAVDVQNMIKSSDGKDAQTAAAATDTSQWKPGILSCAPRPAVIMVLLVAASYTINGCLMYLIGCWEICVLGALSLLAVALRTCCVQWLPASFSSGEATVAGQGLAFFFLSVLSTLFRKETGEASFSVQNSYSPDVIVFMQTAVVSCLLVTWCLYKFPSCRHPLLYYPQVLAVMGLFSLPVLYFYISQNFVLWILQYVTYTTSRMYLFAYWTSSSVVAGVIVTVNSRRLAALDQIDSMKQNVTVSTNTHAKDLPAESSIDIDKKRQSVVTVARKHFHLFAICVFVPGLMWDREMLCNGATCAMVVFVMLEGLRIPKIPPFGAVLDQYFQVLVDSRDAGPVILTHMYLLAGLAIPLWLHPTPLDSGALLPLLSGVLSLGVGDTAASVVGSKLGTHRWSGTKKTIEGTLAAILFQLLGVSSLHWLGWLSAVPWTRVFVAVVMTSLLEAFTTQIDNLILPLFMYVMLV